jgi:hypothetical protein
MSANALLAKRTVPFSPSAMTGTGNSSSAGSAWIWRDSTATEPLARREGYLSGIRQPNCTYAVSSTYAAVSASVQKRRKSRSTAARWFAAGRVSPGITIVVESRTNQTEIRLAMALRTSLSRQRLVGLSNDPGSGKGERSFRSALVEAVRGGTTTFIFAVCHAQRC